MALLAGKPLGGRKGGAGAKGRWTRGTAVPARDWPFCGVGPGAVHLEQHRICLKPLGPDSQVESTGRTDCIVGAEDGRGAMHHEHPCICLKPPGPAPQPDAWAGARERWRGGALGLAGIGGLEHHGPSWEFKSATWVSPHHINPHVAVPGTGRQGECGPAEETPVWGIRLPPPSDRSSQKDAPGWGPL